MRSRERHDPVKSGTPGIDSRLEALAAHRTKAMSPLVLDRPAAEPEAVARVLAEIAEISSETLELQDVFDRVAAAIRRVIPFEHMGVVRILDGKSAVLHATTLDQGECLECDGPMPLTSWSARVRPRPGPIARVTNAPVELVASFPCDAEILSAGVQATMWEPFRSRESFAGGVWLCSKIQAAFTDEHQQILRPIAALLGSAVEHWRLWDTERRRRDRLDRVESLAATIAGSLDVREVFGRISEAMKPVLPHDVLVLTELDPVRHSGGAEPGAELGT